MTVNGTEADTARTDGWWVVSREWNDGDEVVLVLPLQPRFVVADPRLDVARGTVAVEYGPLVYCMEAVDNPGHRLDDLTIDTAIAPKVAPVDGTLGRVATIRIGSAYGLGLAPRGGLTVLRVRQPETNSGNRSH